MKIKVADIPEEGMDVDEQAAVRLDEHETSASVRLHIDKSGSRVLVKGTIDAGMRLTCGRCLREFVLDVSIPVDLAYNPVEEMQAERGAIGKEELDIGFYGEGELDTGTVAAEQLLLNVPIKVLCSDECKGICSRCGRDLNVEGCTCPPEEKTPHGGGLKFKFKGN